MEFDQCREILLQESELVQKIASLQNLIREAVFSRNWTDFQDHFDGLGVLRDEFASLEDKREQLFTGIRRGSGASARFYTFVTQFSQEHRAELTAIYRSLKFETMRVRMAGESLMSYISEARATIAGFFEVAFPDRGGKLYTPHGIPVSHDLRSMVLNRAF